MPTPRSLTSTDHQIIIDDVIREIQDGGFIYDLGKGSLPVYNKLPARGTRMNCEAAARLAINLAAARGADGARLIKARFAGSDVEGFLVIAKPGIKALGNNGPVIDTPCLSGWEFDKHFRVEDKFGRIYDPTFGTSGYLNPEGIGCSSESQEGTFGSSTFALVAVYGGKYQVKKFPTKYETAILSPSPVGKQFILDNGKYIRCE